MKRVKLKIVGGNHRRTYVPLTFSADARGLGEVSAVALRDARTGSLLPVQVEEAQGRLNFSWIQPVLEEREERRAELLVNPDVLPEPEEMRVEIGDKEIKVFSGAFHVLSYRFRDVVKPYVYPLNAPNGIGLTEDGPRDHVHHRSLWVAHGDVNGVDIWSEMGNHGYIKHASFTKVSGGACYAAIGCANDWTDASGRRILYEERLMRIWNIPSGEWVVDFSVRLSARYGDVLLGDTKEGGIVSLRVAPTMTVAGGGGRITNSWGGVNEEEVWGRRAFWCDYSGRLGGEIFGISVFDWPGNPRSPTYWHARNYGLMAANIFGLSYFVGAPRGAGNYMLDRGRMLEFRYRLYVHRGFPEEALVKEKYIDFVHPPKIEVT